MACDYAGMDDQDVLEQLRADIFDAFAPGSNRDVWLAWFARLPPVLRKALANAANMLG
jgi:hypothetical protein